MASFTVQYPIVIPPNCNFTAEVTFTVNVGSPNVEITFTSPDNPAFAGAGLAPLSSRLAVCSLDFTCGEKDYRICVEPAAGLTWGDVDKKSEVVMKIQQILTLSTSRGETPDLREQELG